MGSDSAAAHWRARIVEVSTHAPAWGATLTGDFVLPGTRVSTHAPAWGATPISGLSFFTHFVSTHAPAWGATVGAAKVGAMFMFQPTLPHGERLEKRGT